jgi:Arc/MetJ-type ribon-helix-helix transcriptional regulator
MSKRLQVVLDDGEYREIQQIARRQRMSVSEWVRQALRRVRRSEPVRDAEVKLEAVRAALRHEFPTADIDRMLAEIERGYLGDGGG